MSPLDVIRRSLARFLHEELCDFLQAGAHCGLCGKWVAYEIAPKNWAVCLCDKCEACEFDG